MKRFANIVPALCFLTALLGGCNNYFINRILGEEEPAPQTLFAVRVSASPVEGGVIVPRQTEASAGADIAFAVYPAQGFRQKPQSPAVNGGEVPLRGSGPLYSFTMPAGEALISAEFEQVPAGTWTITVSPDLSGGYIIPSRSTALEGEAVILTVNADAGFRLKENSLKLNNGAVSYTEYQMGPSMSGAVYTFAMPAAHVHISAEFEAAPAGAYTVSLYPGISGGTVISSRSSAEAGTSIALYIRPDPGYRLKAGSLRAGGVSFQSYQGVTAYYTFTMPASDITVSAEFEALPASAKAIVIDDMLNGTIIPTVFNAESGALVTLYVMPGPGYALDTGSLTANNGGVSLVPLVSGTVYTFVMPGADVTVRAEFDAIPGTVYEIAVSETVSHGFIVPNAMSAPAGETVYLYAMPEGEYRLKPGTLKVNNGAVFLLSLGPVHIFTMPAANVTVSAEFEALADVVYTVTISSDISYGRISADIYRVPAGMEVTLYVLPEPEYRLKAGSLKVNNGEVPLGGSDQVYTFTMPAADVTVRAEFELIFPVYTISVDSLISHGTISPGLSGAIEGTQVSLNVQPDADYRLKAGTLKANNGEVPLSGAGPAYTFTMPAANVTLSAQFERVYTVSVDSLISHGTISPDLSLAVEGAVVSLSVQPDPGYILTEGSLTVNGGEVPLSGAGQVYTFTMPAANVTVSAGFEALGQGNITLAFSDLGQGAFSQSAFTISKSGTPDPQTQTVTLSGTWDSSPPPRWDIDNGLISVTGTGISVNAANLNAGGHSLTATVYKNGVPWSKSLDFTVNN
jgi:hypothetical protein